MGANDLYTLKGETLTAQAKSIQTNRVLLGAFDTVDTSNANYNLIYRNSINIDLSSFSNWEYVSAGGYWYTGGLNNSPNVKLNQDYLPNSHGYTRVIYSIDGQWIIYTSESSNSPSGFVQCELLDNLKYTEKVIKGVPILNLDQSGANWLRSEWEKGLNLFDLSNYAYDGDSYRYFKVKISKLGTYYLSSTINPVRFELYQNGSKIFDFTESHSFALTSSNFDLTKTLDIYVSDNHGDYSVNANSVMLNEGDHAYSYQPYSGVIVHEKDIENVAYKNIDNDFSHEQTITSTNEVALKLKSTYNICTIQFNYGNVYCGDLGVRNYKPYWWGAVGGKPSGYLLTEDDIDSVPTDGSTKAVSSNGVYDSITTVTAIAEGKTKSYTIALSSNASFNTQADAVSSVSSITDISGNTINVSSLKNGDIILIIDLEVPDRWYSATDGKFYKMETSKVDLNNYLQRDGSNTITGTILPATNDSYDLGAYNMHFHYVATKRLIATSIHNGQVSGSNEITIPSATGTLCVNSIDNTFTTSQNVTGTLTATVSNSSSNSHSLEAVNGTVAVINYGNTLTIGNLNNGYCHFMSSTNNFYFNKSVHVEGTEIAIYNTNWKLTNTGELSAKTVKIDQKATMQYNSNEDCIDFIFN